MAFDPQDSKWTAYVLGELDDDARHEIEAELAASPDAQRHVDEIRRTIDLVSAELQAEPFPALADAEPALTFAQDDAPEPRAKLFRSIRPEGHSRTRGRVALIASLAASLLAAVGIGGFLLSGGGQVRQAIVALSTVLRRSRIPPR